MSTCFGSSPLQLFSLSGKCCHSRVLSRDSERGNRLPRLSQVREMLAGFLDIMKRGIVVHGKCTSGVNVTLCGLIVVEAIGSLEDESLRDQPDDGRPRSRECAHAGHDLVELMCVVFPCCGAAK